MKPLETPISEDWAVTPQNLTRVEAALKCERAISEDSDDDAFFMDHEDYLLDPEILKIVAEKYPYVIGHIQSHNTDGQFVRAWFKYVPPSQVRAVYQDARKNAMTVILPEEELRALEGKK